MLRSITNYNCRFISDLKQPVYIIVRQRAPQKRDVHHEEFYTVPFYNRQTHDRTNVLIAFQSKEIADAVLNSIGSSQDSVADIIEQHESSIKDVMYYATILKMPVAVVMSMYCSIEPEDLAYSTEQENQHFEIYYRDTSSQEHRQQELPNVRTQQKRN